MTKSTHSTAARLLIFTVFIVQVAFMAVARADVDIPDFVKLAKDNNAAVVNINTTEKIHISGSRDMPFPGFHDRHDPFNEFFKRFFQQQPGMPHDEERQSLGSGFIISPDGYVLTNAHVVKDADKINVRLHDHTQESAKVIGMDERTDVALLKIDGHDLPTVKIGNSDKVQVGQWVLAIGSPFGFDYTATHGIVSALGRTLPNDVYVPFIQTDVAVNPGNSGGPLINADGEVVGINSQIYSSTGGYMGLSFAVPINVAMKVVDELKAHGHVTHSWLGVLIQPVTSDLAKSFGLDHARGALVAQVEPDSPASRAGLKPGDIILSYNGLNIDKSSALPAMVGDTKVGETVPLKIWRNGESLDMEATIAAMGKEAMSTNSSSNISNVLHIRVADLDRHQRKRLGLENYGVQVTDVEDGPADDAGIQEGDILLRIDNRDIKDASMLAKLEDKLPKGRPLSVLIQRDGSPRFLAMTIPK